MLLVWFLHGFPPVQGHGHLAAQCTHLATPFAFATRADPEIAVDSVASDHGDPFLSRPAQKTSRLGPHGPMGGV
jgi:hypothetical protein